jgi:hypothetical protein
MKVIGVCALLGLVLSFAALNHPTAQFQKGKRRSLGIAVAAARSAIQGRQSQPAPS